jgi:hypothetical protein
VGITASTLCLVAVGIASFPLSVAALATAGLSFLIEPITKIFSFDKNKLEEFEANKKDLDICLE